MPQVKYGSTVLVHYTAMLKNGKVVESTAGGDPVRVTVGQKKVMRGLEEALEGMSPGESRRITIPPEKAYGRKKPGSVSHFTRDTTSPIGESRSRLQQQVVNAGTPEEFSITSTDRGFEVDTGSHLAGEEIVLSIDVVDII
jgi:FKBP-type peptidyl-prolyl cis-trans isomerase 2